MVSLRRNVTTPDLLFSQSSSLERHLQNTDERETNMCRIEALKRIRPLLLKSLLINIVLLATIPIVTYIMDSPFAYLKWATDILLIMALPLPLLLYSILWGVLFKPRNFKTMLWGGISTSLLFALLYFVYFFTIDKTNLLSVWIDRMDVVSLIYLFYYPLFCFGVLFVIWFVSTLIFGVCKFFNNTSN